MGLVLNDARSRPLRGIVRRHAHEADFTVSQAERLTEILTQRIGLDPQVIATIPNCPPADFISNREPRRNPNGRFLFVGRNDPRKGLATLLRAFAAVDGASL
jgi:glycosyltransferase involved in cell wall biosynthesis